MTIFPRSAVPRGRDRFSAAAPPCRAISARGDLKPPRGLLFAFALLLSLTLAAPAGLAQAVASPSAAAGAKVSPQALQETRQLLEWLGVSALLEQAPMALASSLEAEARMRRASTQQTALWRRQLTTKINVSSLQRELLHYVAERYQQEAFQHVSVRLQDPLARRVRFFELATAQPNAIQGLRVFRENLKREESKYAQAGPADSTQAVSARRALVRSLDHSAGTSAFAAALQTYIGETVRRSIGAAPVEPELLRAELAERQRYLAPFTEDYLLYAYRYLKDEELAAYRDLLGDSQMQWLLNVCQQGLIATLEGVD